MNRRELLKAAAALPLAQATLANTARAQVPYPTRNITMIVPFPPGGQADLAARPVALALERILGKSVIVDNRAGGGGGSVGNAAAARAEADGYTLLMTLSSLAVLPEADRLFDRPVAYEVSQFAPIARVLADPTLLAVPASAPWKTLQEFVDDAKKRPGADSIWLVGALRHAACGDGDVRSQRRHQAAACAVSRRGSRADRAPDRHGTGDGVGAGHAEAAGRRRQDARAGELGRRAGRKFSRSADLQGARLQGRRVLHLGRAVRAKALPAPLMTRLREAMAQAVKAPEVTKTFETAGSPVAYLDAPEFAKFVEADSARLIAAVKKIGKVE